MARQRKQYSDDDGRTIANMNVDGMPWYIDKAKRAASEGGGGAPGNELRGKNRNAFIWGVLKASLLVAVVFVIGFFLFILFCTKVWFA